MRNRVRFRSEQFTPSDREPWQVSGERFGYALATWVVACLGERGFAIEGPVPEHWGWLLEASRDGQMVRVGCENVEGSLTHWVISLEAPQRGGAIRRLFRRDDAASAPNVTYGIAAVIHGALRTNPHASEIEWFRLGPGDEEIDCADTPI